MILLIKARLLQKIAKADSLDKFSKLITSYLSGEKMTDEEFDKALHEHFDIGKNIVHYSEEYAQIRDLVKRSYPVNKILTDTQEKALSDTLSTKAQNLLQMKDYADRGTRYVQIRAIMDNATTPQCRQMHGRIFKVSDCMKYIPDQKELVYDNEWWASTNSFKGTPTSKVPAALPPYHYRCRTRAVPYIFEKEYDEFDKMKPDHPEFGRILNDRFQNYDLTEKHLPGIVSYAEKMEWSKNELKDHFGRHNKEFQGKYQSEEEYAAGALELLHNSKNISLLASKNGHLVIYAWEPRLNSKSNSQVFTIFDLSEGNINSFYIKRLKQFTDEFESESLYKHIIFKR